MNEAPGLAPGVFISQYKEGTKFESSEWKVRGKPEKNPRGQSSFLRAVIGLSLRTFASKKNARSLRRFLVFLMETVRMRILTSQLLHPSTPVCTDPVLLRRLGTKQPLHKIIPTYPHHIVGLTAKSMSLTR